MALNFVPSISQRLPNFLAIFFIYPGYLFQNSIVGVIGTVGSGKSSLLSAIMAEMHREQGLVAVVNMNDGFGLAAQEPWIQNASIKDNILFGKTFCEEKYTAVLEACALEEDLKVDGDAYFIIV